MKKRTTARDYPRTARLNTLVRDILARELGRIDDERLEFVTLTSVVVDGVQVYDGETVVIGDVEALGDAAPAAVSYELLCRRHWIAGETGRLDDATERALSAT